MPIDRACTSKELTLPSSTPPVMTCPGERSPVLRATKTPDVIANSKTKVDHAIGRQPIRLRTLVCSTSDNSRMMIAARAVYESLSDA